MKIISLNAWGGQVNTIKDFIEDQSTDTDIFCFQESLNKDGQIFCLDKLGNYQHIYDHKKVTDFDNFHQSTFIKENFNLTNSTTISKDDNTVGLAVFTQIELENKTINICNVHGFARPGDKKDNPSRIRFSQTIIDFFKNISGPKIIMGDFNLDLNIKSVDIFKEYGYKNLIEEFDIKTTRNHFAWDKYPDKQLFADHFFVSPEIKVKNFSVPNIDISDHLPMVLEFEI